MHCNRYCPRYRKQHPDWWQPFWVLNGDIEGDKDGNEVYICTRMKKDSSESEDVFSLVKDMPQPIQDYIAVNKRFVEKDRDGVIL